MQPEVPQIGAAPETEAPTRFGSFSLLKQRLKEVKQSTVGRLTQQQKQPSTPGVQQQEANGSHHAPDDDDNSTVISETSSVVQQKLEQLLRPAAAPGPSTVATGTDAGAARGGAAQTGGSGGLNLTVRRFKASVKLPVQQGTVRADSGFPAVATPGFARSVSTISSASAASSAAPADGASVARPHLRISLNGSLSRGAPAVAADTADAWAGHTGLPAAAAHTAADKSIAPGPSRSARSEVVADGRSRSNSDTTPATAGDVSAPTAPHPSRRRSILDPLSIVVPGAQDVPAATAAAAAPSSASTSAMKRLSSSGRPADTVGSATVGNTSNSSQPVSTAAPAAVAAVAAVAGDCAGLQLQLPASRFREHSRDGSAAAAAAATHPAPPLLQQQPYTRATAPGPHIFAAFQVPAHLYNSQEDILNDTDIQELLGKVERCVGAKEHPRILWHMRTSSISSFGAESAAASSAAAAARGLAEDRPQGQGTTSANGAHQSLNGSAARQIHVHVDEQDDGQLSVIISDMEDPDSSVLLPTDLARNAGAASSSAAGQTQQHSVLEVSASDHGSSAAGATSHLPGGGFSLAARRTSTSGNPAGFGLSSRASSVTGAMRPTIGSMIAARISFSDYIPAAVSNQQQQHGQEPAVAPAAAAAAAPELQKSASVRSTARPSRRSIEAPSLIVGLSSAALAAAEEHQQQQAPQASSLHASTAPEHAIAAAAAEGTHSHGGVVQRVHSTVSNDDTSSCCDSQSDLSLLANPLQFVDTLRQRMSKHLWTPAAAAAASGGEEGTAAAATAAVEGECASPGNTAVRTAQQLDEYFKGHESLQRKAARFKQNLQQRQQQKQQLNHTIANPTAAAAAAAEPAGTRLLLSRTMGSPAGHLDSRLGHNAPASAAATGAAKQGLSTRPAKVLVPGATTSAAAAASENESTYPVSSPTASAVGMGSGLTAAVNSLLQWHEQQQLGPGAKSSKLGAGSAAGLGAHANSASSSVPLAVVANSTVSGPTSSLGIRQSLLRPVAAAAAAGGAVNSASDDEGGGAGLNVDELRQDLEACLRKVG